MSETPMRKFKEAWIYEEDGSITLDKAKAREVKLIEIRAKRDKLLKRTDERWIEEKSKGADTSAIEADKAALRDLPTQAETDLSSRIKDTTIDAYDPFVDLELSEEY